MIDPVGENVAEGDVSGALTAISDAIGNLVTGVPAPIRKNALRAFTQLCTAAVNYPIALLQNSLAEKSAASRARVRLIEVSASQLVEQMQVDPEYAQIAGKKYAEKILRERLNLDKICESAAAEITTNTMLSSTEGDEAPDISADWLNVFENEAAQLSSEQMQKLFGKILAGEIRKPASYSIKTLKLMSQLDNRAAVLFRTFCGLSISLRSHNQSIVDARVVSLGGNAAANALRPSGLSFDDLNFLQEYGLIISDYDSYMDYGMCVIRDDRPPVAFTYQNALWVLKPSLSDVAVELRFNGVALSRSGKELLSIVDIEPNEKYFEELRTYCSSRGLEMVKVV